MKSVELSDFCTGENRPCNRGFAAKGLRYRSSLDWRAPKIFLGMNRHRTRQALEAVCLKSILPASLRGPYANQHEVVTGKCIPVVRSAFGKHGFCGYHGTKPIFLRIFIVSLCRDCST